MLSNRDDDVGLITPIFARIAGTLVSASWDINLALFYAASTLARCAASLAE
jgi:hypothetical protein